MSHNQKSWRQMFIVLLHQVTGPFRYMGMVDFHYMHEVEDYLFIFEDVLMELQHAYEQVQDKEALMEEIKNTPSLYSPEVTRVAADLKVAIKALLLNANREFVNFLLAALTVGVNPEHKQKRPLSDVINEKKGPNLDLPSENTKYQSRYKLPEIKDEIWTYLWTESRRPAEKKEKEVRRKHDRPVRNCRKHMNRNK